MRRTQVYLDEDLWAALRVHARQTGATISELLRQALRERYFGQTTRRRQAMLAFAGSRKDRTDQEDTAAYLRELRKGKRLERLSG